MREHRTFAFSGVNGDLARVVRRDVTNDRQTEAGAPRVSAAGPIDSVEPLEDPIEVAGGMPTPVSLTTISIQPDVAARLDDDLRARIAVLDRVLDQVADCGHQLTMAADNMEVAWILRDVDGDAVLLGRSLCPHDGIVDHVGDGHDDPVDAAPPSSMRDSSSRSSMVRAARWASLDHLVGESPGGRRVVDVGQRLGQHGKRTDRGLQLVADVGDEVGANGIETGAFADVVDGRQRPAVLERDRVNASTRRGGPKNSTF